MVCVRPLEAFCNITPSVLAPSFPLCWNFSKGASFSIPEWALQKIVRILINKKKRESKRIFEPWRQLCYYENCVSEIAFSDNFGDFLCLYSRCVCIVAKTRCLVLTTNNFHTRTHS